jgi:hypothetical protein
VPDSAKVDSLVTGCFWFRSIAVVMGVRLAAGPVGVAVALGAGVGRVGDSGLRVWALSVAVFVSSLFPSHSRAFVNVRLSPCGFFGAGHGRWRISVNELP